jgi:hypothetical protein
MATIDHCPTPEPGPMESCNPIDECIGMVPRYIDIVEYNKFESN